MQFAFIICVSPCKRAGKAILRWVDVWMDRWMEYALVILPEETQLSLECLETDKSVMGSLIVYSIFNQIRLYF